MTIHNAIPAGFKLRHVLENPADTVKEIAWSPTESLLATRSENHIDIWNTDTKQLQQNFASMVSIHHHSWSPDGRFLTYITTEKTIVFWDTYKNGALMAPPLAVCTP
jgi:WD40 repeat protein